MRSSYEYTDYLQVVQDFVRTPCPKGGAILALVGHLRFFRAVLLTGDSAVKTLTVDVPVVQYATPCGRVLETSPDFIFEYRNGKRIWETVTENPAVHEAGARRLDALRNAAAGAGAEHRVFTKRDTKGNEILFDNWTVLSACMNRAHPNRFTFFREQEVLSECLQNYEFVRLQTLLEQPEVDRAKMLSAVGFGLMHGALRTNLQTALFSLASEIRTN